MKLSFKPLMILSGILLFTFPESVKACSCGEYFTPPCAAYWRSDAVFVGTVLEIGVPYPSDKVRFKVEESFKGVDQPEIVIDASFGGCYDRSWLKIKEKYLVYAKQEGGGRWSFWPWPCARFIRLSDAGGDLRYLNKLRRKEVTQSVTGIIEGLDKDELTGTKILVKGQGVEINSVPKYVMRYTGHYEIKLPGAGTFTVQLTFPLKLRGWGIREVPHASQTIVEYSVTLAEYQCDYKEMGFAKVSEGAH